MIHRSHLSVAAVALAMTGALFVPSAASAADTTSAADTKPADATSIAESASSAVVEESVASAAPGAQFARPKPTDGFVPVRQMPGVVERLYSPRPGELWALRHADRGGTTIHHLVDGHWSYQRLGRLPGDPGQFEDNDYDLAGSGPDDVWAVAASALWHYDGAEWSSIDLPPLADGRPGRAYAVAADLVGPAYVDTSQGVVRRDGAGWTGIGAPPYRSDRPGSLASARRLVVVDGVLHGMFRRYDGSWFTELWKYDAGTWTALAGGFGYSTRGGSIEANEFVVTGGRFFAFGDLDSGPYPREGFCHTWTAAEGGAHCETGQPVGGAAVRADGTIVLGGKNRLGATNSAPPVPGSFVARDEKGTETPVPGDVGSGATVMTAEPGTNTVWAVTVKGGTTTLQRWVG